MPSLDHYHQREKLDSQDTCSRSQEQDGARHVLLVSRSTCRTAFTFTSSGQGALVIILLATSSHLGRENSWR